MYSLPKKNPSEGLPIQTGLLAPPDLSITNLVYAHIYSVTPLETTSTSSLL